MKKTTIILLLALLALYIPAYAEKAEKELSAREILDRADLMNDAQDQSSSMKMVLIDKNGEKSTREVKLFTKGGDKRLIKFESPADVKGVGFLVLNADKDDEMMWLYLPAFKKVRRIAGSAKSGSFMGSDFSYDDIGSTNYSGDYDSKRLKDEDDRYVLELKKKEKSDVDYDKLILWVSREVFVPVKVEFYKIKKTKDEERYELAKLMRVENIKKIKKYWVPTSIIMEDVKKDHKTVLELDEILIDSGLTDSIFTQRYLQR